jgi:hypothetical protein
MPLAGTGTVPNGYPVQPIGIYNPRPYPGLPPGYHVGYPPYLGGPGIPVVMNPVPYPGTPPYAPLPNPGTPPTIPIGLPTPSPTEPPDDSNEFWSPWPLPPRGSQTAVLGVGFGGEGKTGGIRQDIRSSGVDGVGAGLSANDLPQQHYVGYGSAAADDDLKYRGGKLIRNLSYVNLYISGDTEWSAADVERIDANLSAAMRDEHLNNVLLQYYDNQPITSSALPSHPLVGYTPGTVTRGDIDNYVNHLYRQGFLRSFDLDNTVFNFLLPPGTVLADRHSAANGQRGQDSEVADSAAGLGGFHGSVVTADGGRVYFAVGVYSQRFANGATNGIPVFSEPWKNVVATLYHQLTEARTNPDVEDAIRESSDLNADRNLGWVSDSGLEIGDLPLRANVPLTSVVREVPLADGSGTVPVQLPYSNFVHGFEGPVPQPHPLPSR